VRPAAPSRAHERSRQMRRGEEAAAVADAFQ